MSEEEHLRRLDESLVAIEDLFTVGQIDESTYLRNLVEIANEYAKADEVLTAAAIVQRIPEAYFRDVYPKIARADARYAETGYSLARAFERAGLVEVGPSLVPTQAPATA